MFPSQSLRLLSGYTENFTIWWIGEALMMTGPWCVWGIIKGGRQVAGSQKREQCGEVCTARWHDVKRVWRTDDWVISMWWDTAVTHQAWWNVTQNGEPGKARDGSSLVLRAALTWCASHIWRTCLTPTVYIVLST